MSDSRARVIEKHVARLRRELTLWARHMAARYDGPVYLCGSVLVKPAPRDIDIRLVIQDNSFAARYGNALVPAEFNEYHKYYKRGVVKGNAVEWDKEGPTQRWIDDMAKFNDFLSQKLKENFDVQAVPDTWYRDRVYPAPILLAAPSPNWFIYNRYVPDPTKKQRIRRLAPQEETPDHAPGGPA